RVPDPCRHPRLVEEHRQKLVLAREVGMKSLDGDNAREARGAERTAEVHGRHAARCDLVVDRVALVDDVGTGQAHRTNLSTRETNRQDAWPQKGALSRSPARLSASGARRSRCATRTPVWCSLPTTIVRRVRARRA